MSLQSNGKPDLSSSQLLKTLTSIRCKLGPVIWSRDTGQKIPCFDRCQLTLTWMSNIKDVSCKPRLNVSVNLLAGVWPPCCMTVVYTRHHQLCTCILPSLYVYSRTQSKVIRPRCIWSAKPRYVLIDTSIRFFTITAEILARSLANFY